MQRNMILAVMITGALLGGSPAWADPACEVVNGNIVKENLPGQEVNPNAPSTDDSTSSADQSAAATEPGPKNSNASDAKKKVP